MQRRIFLENLVTAGLGVNLLPDTLSAFISNNTQINIEEITINQVQNLLISKTATITEIVGAFLERIDQIDKNGPALNSIIQINPKALSIASQLDKEWTEGNIRGPLHGIPVILKDNIDTIDMPTTAGSRALMHSTPLKNSIVADKLINAGAVILGKANLSEWANFRGRRSSSGWSGLGGLTKNPYVLDRNTCGSSSGSGASVSASLCVIAIGTETNGSIICPSNANGVVGIKPTVGLISRNGIIPISFTQDTAGPMARTVRDAVICLGAMTGVDAEDAKTTESVGQGLSDYTPYLDKNGLQGKKLAHFTSLRGRHAKVDTLMDVAIEKIRSLGAEIIEIEQISASGVSRNSFEVMLYEYKDGLNKYFDSLGPEAPIKNLEELIDFNKNDAVELQHFGQEYLIQAQEKGDLSSAEYLEALDAMLKGRREDGIDKIMDEHSLDGFISPSGGPAWKTDLINGDNSGMGSSSPAAQAGYPNITVPMGFISELPVGLSFFGRAWSEPVLIEMAYAFEQSTKHRRAPKYLQS